MAELGYAIAQDAFGVQHITWSALTGADTGRPVNISAFNDKSVQLGAGASNANGGIWGGSTTIIQGTNDKRGDPQDADHANAAWVTLHDPLGNNLSFTAAGLKQILENVRWIRPSQSAGAAGNLDIIITAKRSY